MSDTADDVDIVIEIYKGHTTKGAQAWRWRAFNARNYRKLANGNEAYANEQDVVTAICSLFGDESTIVLRQHNDDGSTRDELLRESM